MSRITVKSELNNDLRRFPVNTQITFVELVETVKNLYKIENLRLKYRDEDGDAISLTDDDELREAFEFAKSNKNLLRLIVKEGSLLDSWVVVDPIEEVRELRNELLAIKNQLEEVVENPVNVPKNDNDISPTAAKYYSSKNSDNLSGSFIKLPSWGKNSLTNDDLSEMIANNNNNNNNANSNNNNNNNAQLLPGERTDLKYQNAVEPPKPRSKISQVVSENSNNLVHDLKDLTSKIANLVVKSSEIPSSVKNDLLQTNMRLAEMTIANCQSYSQKSSAGCLEYSDRAKDIVNNAISDQKKRNDENSANKQEQEKTCDNLRSVTSQNCSDLSHATAENCLKGANSIRDLIMNL